MRTVKRDSSQTPFIDVQDEYYQHRDTLVVAKLTHFRFAIPLTMLLKLLNFG